MELAKKFEIHYHLLDESHSMNALIKNKCEAEFLAIASEIAEVLGINVVWESQALEEGGIREIWAAMGSNNSQIAIVISVIAILLSMVPQSDQELIDLQKEETRLSIEEKKLAIEKLKKDLEEETTSKETIKNATKIVKDNHKIVTRRSNFYKTLSDCEKVYQVGFSSIGKNNQHLEEEKIVKSQDFIRFILTSHELKPVDIESARIEIVSPVLKEGKAKWKGIYEGEHISFAMDDHDFKYSVLSQQVAFKNGSEIICAMRIHRKINELGEVITSGYSVSLVIEKIEAGLSEETHQGRRHKHAKKLIASQKDLFT